jgi:hypothetical protein
MLADAPGIAGRGGGQGGHPLVGEHGEPPAAVRGAQLAADLPGPFEPADRVADPARLGAGGLGQLAHPQRAARGVVQQPQDLEVRARHPHVVLEVVVELDVEPPAGPGEGPEDPQFVLVEPDHVAHGG